MEITTTLKAADRDAWRAWLSAHHTRSAEIWLLSDDRVEVATVSYLDAVEEALCFGWIDGIAKRYSPSERAQRFTARRARSNWTELNKARAGRLERLGLMTDAGRAVLPDLTPRNLLRDDVAAALKATPGAWENFQGFPSLYQRVRLGNIEGMRKDPTEFARLLKNFVAKSAANQLYGNWNDGGRLE